MGIPLKESLRELEDMASRQIRIWPDACDIAFPFNDEITKIKARKELKSLLGFYGGIVERYGEGNKNSTTTLAIPVEIDYGLIICIILTVDYNSAYAKYGGISIDSRRESLDKRVLIERYKSKVYSRDLRDLGE